MSGDYDWHADESEVVVPPNEGVAVYRNSRGDIVIRAKADGQFFDHDPFVVVPVEAVEKLIARLRELVGQ
jgi:hypothetical protein